uniref:Uncharacterized protein n=1 Tax=Graphocephala atropunctata TaxID=36148 RepID=A0A1B6KZB2_9HEMI
MKTNRLDNYWVEAPPNFLHRVGIYHMREYKEPEGPMEDFSHNLHSRKERCLGCNPSLLPNKVRIPEERVPWEAPRKRVSRRSSSFIDDSEISDIKVSSKKWSNESLAKINTTPNSGQSSADLRFPLVETHSISLKHGALQLVVNFPPQTTVKLRTGGSERLLQSEYCDCSRASDNNSAAQ